MKSSFMRPAMAFALALGLAACGGKASFPVNVNVDTLQGPVWYSGLVLTTNGMDLAVPAGTSTITFPNSLSYGEAYVVTVKSDPLHQHCTVSGGNDTAGRMASINVMIGCTVNAVALGGTITGLTADGLVLTNGSTGGTAAPANGATTFAMIPVAYGLSYGVTVLTQPTGLTCTVSNGTGVMGDDPVTNVAVNCAPTP